MMLTKEQAAFTWCPMVRLDRDDSGAHCIANQCAMWRLVDKPAEPRKADKKWPDEDDVLIEPPRPDNLPASWEWVPLTGEGDDLTGGFWQEPQTEVDADNARAAAARRGYCGLAGPVVVSAS